MKASFGRRQLVAKGKLKDQEIGRPTMKIEKNEIRCLRCNTVHRLLEVKLPTGVCYCPACIQLGRLATNQQFITEAENVSTKRTVAFCWSGQLSPLQKAGAQEVVNCILAQKNLLLWAVTGSGKTEMLFWGILQALQSGKRVAVATPRIDVCRELFPRFQAVFPELDILLLYGDSDEKYRYSALTICTTHQLLHFYRAFDVLIIDEVDAFPYDGDPKLAYAAKKARKPKSSLIYLSATPSKNLIKKITKSFQIHKIPARYHRRALSEPQLFWWNDWQRKALKGQKLQPLIKLLRKLLVTCCVLLFCPSIQLMKRLAPYLIQQLKEFKIAEVSSIEPDREKIVERMRKGHYDVLMTTTILERGVTFTDISVIILGANHPVFNQAALIQIAGRVDRKSEPSSGESIFIYDEMTGAMKNALKQIRKMNVQAKKAGYLDEM